MATKLLIVDDHPVVRAGLRAMLAATDFEVVAEAENGRAALELLQRMPLDLVLLDARMPVCDGIRFLEHMEGRHFDLPVLMISSSTNPALAARASVLGAKGCVNKTITRDQLLNALRRVAAGESIWTPDELHQFTALSAGEEHSLELDVPLTKREFEVLRYVALGLTNKQIARSLGISYETVKEHVQHILRKLKVSDRTQAAVWAVKVGLA